MPYTYFAHFVHQTFATIHFDKLARDMPQARYLWTAPAWPIFSIFFSIFSFKLYGTTIMSLDLQKPTYLTSCWWPTKMLFSFFSLVNLFLLKFDIFCLLWSLLSLLLLALFFFLTLIVLFLINMFIMRIFWEQYIYWPYRYKCLKFFEIPILQSHSASMHLRRRVCHAWKTPRDSSTGMPFKNVVTCVDVFHGRLMLSVQLTLHSEE